MRLGFRIAETDNAPPEITAVNAAGELTTSINEGGASTSFAMKLLGRSIIER